MSTEAGGQAVVRAQPVCAPLNMILLLHLLTAATSSSGFPVVSSVALWLAWALMLLFKLRPPSCQVQRSRLNPLLGNRNFVLPSQTLG